MPERAFGPADSAAPLIELPLATRYAIEAAVWLSKESPDVFFSIRDVAEDLDLPPDFLAKVFRRLLHKGLVHARRGPGGGYRLSRNPSEIRLLDIAAASVPAPTGRRQCMLYARGCGDACCVHEAVLAAEKTVREALGRFTIRDLGGVAPSRSATAPESHPSASLDAPEESKDLPNR